MTPKERAEVRKRMKRADAKAAARAHLKSEDPPQQVNAGEIQDGGNELGESGKGVSMFGKIGKWWHENKYIAGALTCLGVVLGIFVGIVNTGKYIYELSSQESVEWVTGTTPMKPVPENKISKEDRERLQTFRAMTAISMPNQTPFKLRSPYVQAQREGTLAVTDGTGDIIYFGPFKGRYDLPDIPPHSHFILTLYHNKLPDANERIILSSEETGKHEYPYSSTVPLVSAWYQWAFWLCVIIISLLVGWIMKVWEWFGGGKKK